MTVGTKQNQIVEARDGVWKKYGEWRSVMHFNEPDATLPILFAKIERAVLANQFPARSRHEIDLCLPYGAVPIDSVVQ